MGAVGAGGAQEDPLKEEESRQEAGTEGALPQNLAARKTTTHFKKGRGPIAPHGDPRGHQGLLGARDRGAHHGPILWGPHLIAQQHVSQVSQVGCRQDGGKGR